MEIEIFDVEHGACALVTADTGARMLIDCGHNTTANWRPSSHLYNSGFTSIDRLFITNYDEDHVSDLPNLRDSVHIRILRRNKSLTSGDISLLKRDTGIGPGMISLIEMIDTYTYDVTNPPDLGALSFTCYHNRYPEDFDDENNLSLVVFLHCYGLHIVFPGDLEQSGWRRLLENASFCRELDEVNIFVASHHGRESGCCEEVFSNLCPEIVIISDTSQRYDTQETVPWYRSRVSGIDFDGTKRKVLTTRRDGRITVTATPDRTLVSKEN